LSNGLGLLTWLGPVVPQGAVVTGVKAGWKLAWQTMVTELAPQSKDGEYRRPTYAFADAIEEDPNAKFPATAGGRYVLYVCNACPWCHRATLTVALRGLDEKIKVVQMTDDAERASRGGWVFETSRPDPVFRAKDLREVYDGVSALGESYRGRCTAPLLVDGLKKRAVCNESSEIIKMLNDTEWLCDAEDPKTSSSFGSVQLRPSFLLERIEETNRYVYSKLNDGVYRSGFATTQVAHARAALDVAEALEALDERLKHERFLCGDKVTESDVRLFPTVVRFDAAYASLFKCSSRRVGELPHLRAWMLDFYLLPGVRETVDVDGYRTSYFGQLFPLNPGGIVPIGPTAKDLGLGVDPNRGSREPRDVFHYK
jgi:putative glutathione S-transferase